MHWSRTASLVSSPTSDNTLSPVDALDLTTTIVLQQLVCNLQTAWAGTCHERRHESEDFHGNENRGKNAPRSAKFFLLLRTVSVAHIRSSSLCRRLKVIASPVNRCDTRLVSNDCSCNVAAQMERDRPDRRCHRKVIAAAMRRPTGCRSRSNGGRLEPSGVVNATERL